MSAPDYLNNAQAWLVEKVLKVEIVVALVVGTFILMTNDTVKEQDKTVTYKSASVVVDYNSRD